ncbi:MAG: hypothetical protein OEM02_04890 [Desulfobulbaceae bacterium]|nr:hypothetical protein [Desulfobulbaceae bacterium]
MSLKKVTFSVRVSQDDAEFISRLSINGAKTPSDKIRSIIKETRAREKMAQDYDGCIEMMRDLTSPVLARLRKCELEEKVHSELIFRAIEWLPELIGFIVSNMPPDKQNKESLLNIEQGVADRIFRMIETVFRMATTKQCRCYDPDVISEKIDPVLELLRVVEIVRNQEQE